MQMEGKENLENRNKRWFDFECFQKQIFFIFEQRAHRLGIEILVSTPLTTRQKFQRDWEAISLASFFF